MKILVFSDSHHNTEKMLYAAEKHENCTDTIIHLGDCFTDTYDIERRFPTKALLRVSGNCDIYDGIYKENSININLFGHKILITHGHLQNVKSSLDLLYEKAAGQNCDICLFGHTHMPLYETRNNITFFNPGSISRPVCGNMPTYGIIDLDEKTAKFKILEVE